MSEQEKTVTVSWTRTDNYQAEIPLSEWDEVQADEDVENLLAEYENNGSWRGNERTDIKWM